MRVVVDVFASDRQTYIHKSALVEPSSTYSLPISRIILVAFINTSRLCSCDHY